MFVFFLRRLGVVKVPLTVPLAFRMPEVYQKMALFLKGRGMEGVGEGILRSHRLLLSVSQDKEAMCPVKGLALGRPSEVWHAVAHPDLLHCHRDLAWLIVQDVLPVKHVMCSRRLATSATCPRTGCGHEETVRYFLWECQAAQDLWTKAHCVLGLYMERGAALDTQTILYGMPGKVMCWRAFWLVLNCCREALWKARNMWVLERKELGKLAVFRIAVGRVKDYMQWDLRRLGQGKAERM